MTVDEVIAAAQADEYGPVLDDEPDPAPIQVITSQRGATDACWRCARQEQVA